MKFSKLFGHNVNSRTSLWGGLLNDEEWLQVGSWVCVEVKVLTLVVRGAFCVLEKSTSSM